jgi:GMC oxidoreductase
VSQTVITPFPLPTGWTAIKPGLPTNWACTTRTARVITESHAEVNERLTNTLGPLTITYRSGSIVAFLPLQKVSDNFQQMIEFAAAVDLKPLLPKDADDSILFGYGAQRDLILNLYASENTTVQEVAFGGGDTVPIAMLKPLSRGSILINTTDPFAPPVIDYGTFSHPTDLDVAVQALKKTRAWMASEAMQEVGAVEVYPGADVQGDTAIEASIRTFASSTWAHPVATLSMMKKEYGGVVNPQLQVYGVRGLRVIDASIMPLIPATHTSSVVYAVAEKVSRQSFFQILRCGLLTCIFFSGGGSDQGVAERNQFRPRELADSGQAKAQRRNMRTARR